MFGFVATRTAANLDMYVAVKIITAEGSTLACPEL